MDPNNTFFTSDSHFGHKNIIRFCRRPYASVEEMDAKLIEAWNSVVKPDSVVYHLGDFAYKSKNAVATILAKLNGRKILVVGNHDDKQHYGQFESFHSSLEIAIAGVRIVMHHFPLLEWDGSHNGSWHLHGHCHGTCPDNGISRRMDVGVDLNSAYRPFSFNEVKQIIGSRNGGQETVPGSADAIRKYF